MHRVNVISAQVGGAPKSAQAATPKSTLTIVDNRSGKTIEVPIESGNINAGDLKALGIQSFDPGYMNTTCCVSRISFIDGNKGILRYRGIPIEVLAEKSDFTETAFLLLRGSLPTKEQLGEWKRDLMSHSMVHSDVAAIISAFRYDSHPMGMFIKPVR